MSVRSSDPMRLEPSFALLDIAETDLAAARTLHQAKLYGQAVFSLQQAVEKTVKAVGLATRAIEPNELQREVSHRTIKVYAAGLRKLLGLPDLDAAMEQQHLAMTAAYLGVVQDHVVSFDDVARPGTEELERWLRASESVRDDSQAFVKGSAAQWDPALLDAISLVSGMPIEGEAIARFINDVLATGADLYWLGLATFAHAVTSRYGDKTRTPSQLYNEKNPLVVQLQRIVAVLEHCQRVARQAFNVAQTFATMLTSPTRA